MAHTLLYIMGFILLLNFGLETVLEILNLQHSKQALPPALKDIYDEKKLQRSRDYEHTQVTFDLFSSTFFLVILIVFLFSGGFAKVDSWVRHVSDSEIVICLLFFGILFLMADLINLPFVLYHTFGIEEKFGFNKTNVRTFIGDKFKSYLLGILMGGSLITIFLLFYEWAGNHFWWLTWIFISFFSVVFSMFYAQWIIPLFNKLTPLPEGDLREAIVTYCAKNDFTLKDLYVMDGSRRSAKANAFFSGLGDKKTIVLYDTLIQNHTTKEIVAVLAHEIGHFKKKHTRTGIILSVFQSGIMLYLLSLFIKNPEFSYALGSSVPSVHLSLISFALLYSPITEILAVFMNKVSRMNEYEADAYAAETYDARALAEALKKLSANNLSNINPHPAYVSFHYSHPTLYQRLSKLNQIT